VRNKVCILQSISSGNVVLHINEKNFTHIIILVQTHNFLISFCKFKLICAFKFFIYLPYFQIHSHLFIIYNFQSFEFYNFLIYIKIVYFLCCLVFTNKFYFV